MVSYIGGLSEIVYIFFSFFAIYMNQYDQLITLANKLYNFEDKDKQK